LLDSKKMARSSYFAAALSLVTLAAASAASLGPTATLNVANADISPDGQTRAYGLTLTCYMIFFSTE